MRPDASTGQRTVGLAMASVVAVALALGGGWWASGLRPDTRPVLTAALDALPVSTRVVGFTDWHAIRRHLDAADVTTDQQRQDLLDDAATRDLSTRSVLAESAAATRAALGWSVADAEWESYGQDTRSGYAAVRLDDDLTFDDVRSRIAESGYAEDDGVWTTSAAELASAGLPSITAAVALVPRRHLVVVGDDATSVRAVLDVVDGRAPSLAGDPLAAGTGEALAGSDSVLMQAGALGCDSTQVDGSAEVQRQLKTALRAAGPLASYGFSGRALAERDGSGFSAQRALFAMTFDSASLATRQARTREQLASGPYIGRSGQVADTLRLRSTTTDGPTLRLAFGHDPATDVVMVGTGPVLFATC